MAIEVPSKIMSAERLRPDAPASPGSRDRARFFERVGHSIARLPSARTVAVIAIGLDHFSELTVFRGEVTGDLVLSEVIRRVREAVAPMELVAWTVGDRFVVACELRDSPGQRRALQARIESCFEEPFAAASSPVYVSASIGIAYSAVTSDDPQQLLGLAEVARAEARRAGGHRSLVVDGSSCDQMREKFEMTQALHRAVARDELHLEYQPIAELSKRAMTGVEALLRWSPTGRGQVPPDIFIPCAEESGLIIPIGRWVIGEVVRQWSGAPPGGGDSLQPSTLTFNVSGAQLDAGLAGLGEDLVEAAAALPGRLSIEITESWLARDPENARAILEWVKSIGVGVIIDDFGMGHSSLRYLQIFPVDALKIDRSFVAHVHENDRDHSIVATIIELAHSLGIIAIAEGVETEQQLDALTALSCDRAQGFYFSRPACFEQTRLGPMCSTRRT